MSVSAIVGLLVGPITKLLGKAIPDKDARDKMAFEIATMAGTQAHEAAMAQVGVNAQEAKHPSVFVSGWRPGVGWVCLVAMANNYVVMPYVAAFGLEIVPMDLTEMMPVLLGMLGLTIARSVDKKNGVARMN